MQEKKQDMPLCIFYPICSGDIRKKSKRKCAATFHVRREINLSVDSKSLCREMVKSPIKEIDMQHPVMAQMLSNLKKFRELQQIPFCRHIFQNLILTIERI